jgi:hypothetical protein
MLKSVAPTGKFAAIDDAALRRKCARHFERRLPG